MREGSADKYGGSIWQVKLDKNNNKYWKLVTTKFGIGAKFVTKLNIDDKRLSNLTKQHSKVLFKLINLQDEFKKINVKLFIYILPDWQIANEVIDNKYIRDQFDWYWKEAYEQLPDKYIDNRGDGNFILYILYLDTIYNKFICLEQEILNLQLGFRDNNTKNNVFDILQKNFNIYPNSYTSTDVDIIYNNKSKSCIIS